MEPVVTAFATIVGLIANYKSETRAEADDAYKDFTDWLGERRHEEILRLLETNTKASISIKALLNQDRELLLERLESIDRVLASISSHVEGISDLAVAIKPGVEISDQALSILRQVEAAGASAFIMKRFIGGQTAMFLLDGNAGQIGFDEQRFLDDDLTTLLSLGLLIQDYNSSGDSVFRITRQAVKMVQLSQ